MGKHVTVSRALLYAEIVRNARAEDPEASYRSIWEMHNCEGLSFWSFRNLVRIGTSDDPEATLERQRSRLKKAQTKYRAKLQFRRHDGEALAEFVRDRFVEMSEVEQQKFRTRILTVFPKQGT